MEIRCQCGGSLTLISLTMKERMRRRIGRSWVGVCDRCREETIVNPSAWWLARSTQKDTERNRNKGKQAKQAKLF